MEERIDNIILFPKWKRKLEEDSLQALKGKRYSEALEKLDQLIAYHVDSEEILVGKLICLMELGEYKEAQDLAESLIQHPSEGYFHYMHIYLTILFQTSQYDLLIETVEEALEKPDIPLAMKEQFQQLYAISENMRSDLTDKQSREDYDDFLKAVASQEHQKQWRLAGNLKKSGRKPDWRIKELLVKEEVHPVVKTVLFQWLQETDADELVEIHKLGRRGTLNPSETERLSEHSLKKQVHDLLKETEQENPSFYRMMNDVLDRYLYVLYPLISITSDAGLIAEAIRIAASPELQSAEEGMDERLRDYIEEINMCQALYLMMLEA